MMTLQFGGLYRYTTQLTPLETDEQALYRRHDKPIPNNTAKWRVYNAAHRQGMHGTQEDGPIYKLHATEPATVDGQPGHRAALITGPDIDVFLTSNFPETFPAEQLAQYQTLKKEERKATRHFLDKNDEIHAVYKEIRDSKRAQKLRSLKLTRLPEFFSYLLFPQEKRRIKDLALERQAAGKEESRLKEEKDTIRDSVYSAYQRLLRKSTADMDARILAYVDTHAEDTSGQPRQEITVEPKR